MHPRTKMYLKSIFIFVVACYCSSGDVDTRPKRAWSMNMGNPLKRFGLKKPSNLQADQQPQQETLSANVPSQCPPGCCPCGYPSVPQNQDTPNPVSSYSEPSEKPLDYSHLSQPQGYPLVQQPLSPPPLPPKPLHLATQQLPLPSSIPSWTYSPSKQLPSPPIISPLPKQLSSTPSIPPQTPHLPTQQYTYPKST